MMVRIVDPRVQDHFVGELIHDRIVASCSTWLAYAPVCDASLSKIGIEFEARILSSTDDSHSESKAALQLRASTSSQGTDEARMAGQKTWV